MALSTQEMLRAKQKFVTLFNCTGDVEGAKDDALKSALRRNPTWATGVKDSSPVRTHWAELIATLAGRGRRPA